MINVGWLTNGSEESEVLTQNGEKVSIFTYVPSHVHLHERVGTEK